MKWLLFAALLACGSGEDGPRLVSATPAAAGHGATVMVSGERMCGASGDCTRAGGQIQIGVAIPAVQAAITSYSDTLASIVIPPAAPAGTTELVLTVNDRASNALAFEVLP